MDLHIYLFHEQNPKSWAKQIQEEWKILEKHLPGQFSIPNTKSPVIFSVAYCWIWPFVRLFLYCSLDTIFVRVYESRMDLMRAVIIGAEGTPYHDGLFFFDIFFPSGYPNVPPVRGWGHYNWLALFSLSLFLILLWQKSNFFSRGRTSITTLEVFGSTLICITAAKYVSVYLTPGLAPRRRDGLKVFQQCYKF